MPRRGKVICALAAHPGQHLAKRFGQRFPKWLNLEVPLLLPLCKLANGEVRLLLAGASFTEGYTPDLHYRLIETRALRPASHLARSGLHKIAFLCQRTVPVALWGALSSWWQVVGCWPWSRRRVGGCPTPSRGGPLGYVTIAPYSCEKGQRIVSMYDLLLAQMG